MENKTELLSKIIENLQLIKDQKHPLSQIEKDIILQNIREAYTLLLSLKTVDTFQTLIVEDKEEKEETCIPVPETIEDEIELEIKIEPELEPEPEPEVKAEPELELELEAESELEAEPEKESQTETVLLEKEKEIAEKEVEVIAEKIEDDDNDELLEFTQQIAPKEKAAEPVESEPTQYTFTEKITVTEETTHSENNNAEQTRQTITEEVQVSVFSPGLVDPAKQPKRSLNDLLNERREDNSLNTKFQNSKIEDLTKSISINDKFLFIRELFKNRGEEFSQAIQTFNNCNDIEEAFAHMDKLKKHYFWDSTSSAYLAFCDLIRRKF